MAQGGGATRMDQEGSIKCSWDGTVALLLEGVMEDRERELKKGAVLKRRDDNLNSLIKKLSLL